MDGSMNCSKKAYACMGTFPFHVLRINSVCRISDAGCWSMLLQFGDIWPIINPISHDHVSSAQRGNILFPFSFILIPAGFKMAFRPRTTARNQSTGSHICAGPSREYLAMLSLLGFFADHLRIGLRLNR